MNTFAIVIAYHPDPEHLRRLCRTLATSGAQVIVVDNSEAGGAQAPFAADSCTRIALSENTGIAHAQNVGISLALERGAEVIVLFDQDSKPDEGFLGRLLTGVIPGEPGVFAPVCMDKAGRELPSHRIDSLGFSRKVLSRGRRSPYPVDLVMASGSAATAATFSVVGKMDEDFFIDFVDFEWCFRCRSRAVPIRVVPGAVMEHSIGERTVDLIVMRGPVHGVSRSYYKIRNCFLLFRKAAVPLSYASSTILFAMLRYVVLLPFVKNRLSYVKVFLLAIRDGVTGVVGKNPAMAKSSEPV